MMKIFPYPEVVGVYTIYRLLPFLEQKLFCLSIVLLKNFIDENIFLLLTLYCIGVLF